MNRNLGTISLKKKVSNGDRMEEFDRLPPYLRRWLRDADLPWSPSSVKRAYFKALRSTGDFSSAISELDIMQSRRLSKERPYRVKNNINENSKMITFRKVIISGNRSKTLEKQDPFCCKNH